MSPGAVLFMAASWSVVLGLAGWSFRRILRSPRSSGSSDRDG